MKTVSAKLLMYMLSVCLVLSIPFIVHAQPTQIFSPTRTLTVQGLTYHTHTNIWCSGENHRLMVGTVFIGTACNTLVPPGTIRGQVWIFSHGMPRSMSELYWNDVSTRGMNVSTPVITPQVNSGLFAATGDVAVMNHNTGNPVVASTETTPIWRSGTTCTQIQAFMSNLEQVYSTNGMVEVMGINDVRGFAFIRELRNATPGYVNVYAGYCLTIVDQFPILPSVVEYIN